MLLQFPGVSQDSAVNGDLHVRNEHANLQVRINGIMMPDGVTGFSSFLDPSWIGSLSLVTGALPAEYGLRTTGLLDITRAPTCSTIPARSASMAAAAAPSRRISSMAAPSAPIVRPPARRAEIDENCVGGVQYFITGRYLNTHEGIENPLPTLNAIHDFSQQAKGFAYLSTFIDPWTRMTMMMGTSTTSYQIPNTPNAPINGSVAPAPFNSLSLNETAG